MVPLYFKFYTNEISKGLKIYFTMGGAANIKIAEKSVGTDGTELKKITSDSTGKQLFSFFDATLILGTGVEYKLGNVTTLFFGVSYNRGLLNTINPLVKFNDYNGNKTKPYDNLAIKNNLFSLDLGLRF